jgi:hypothetical protein
MMAFRQDSAVVSCGVLLRSTWESILVVPSVRGISWDASLASAVSKAGLLRPSPSLSSEANRLGAANGDACAGCIVAPAER